MKDDEIKKLARSMTGDPYISMHGAWPSYESHIREHILNEPMDEFLRWSTMIATMVVGDCFYIREEYNSLPEDIKNRIIDSRVGNPPMIEGTSVSATYSHQAFHLCKFMELSKVDMRDIHSIVEFGGGYGGMAVVARRLGFTGKYVIYDLPVVSLIQRYYLDKVGCEAETISMSNWNHAGALKEPDLFIASYSLSETKPRNREMIFDTLQPYHCLIVHQAIWEGEDLNAYFGSFMRDRPQYTWESRMHPSKWFHEHYYRVGSRDGINAT
jgi:hypothetical protein